MATICSAPQRQNGRQGCRRYGGLRKGTIPTRSGQVVSCPYETKSTARNGCATRRKMAEKQNGRLDLRRAARFVFL
jgi:hypothetical protein